MLEKLPASLGRALRAARPGMARLAIHDDAFADIETSIDISSPAFEDGGALPAKYTADGAGVSPPLAWRGVPAGAATLVLLIEDADSPTPKPLVHAIVRDLPGGDAGLPERALPSAANPGHAHAMGRNSYLATRYLPPDPPPGHGAHRYAFEIFALGTRPRFVAPPGRSRLLEAMRGHVLAKGLLVGTYERR